MLRNKQACLGSFSVASQLQKLPQTKALGIQGILMKVTLDLDHLLSEGKITETEHDKLSRLAAKSTGSLAF